MEGKPFTSSLNIFPDACCKKTVGGTGGVMPQSKELTRGTPESELEFLKSLWGLGTE
jgi:hypothetical protein